MRLLHTAGGRSLALETTENGVELVNRRGELLLTIEQLEWLCIVGGPAALAELRPATLLDDATTPEARR